jgi:endoglucanase
VSAWRERDAHRTRCRQALDLPTPPGADPLNGASFFIPGPAHGSAASAIAQLVGLNATQLPASESWASFQSDLTNGPLSQSLAANPSLAHQVQELSKIASEPEAQRFSIFSEGGGPGAIFEIRAYDPVFQRRVNEMAAGIENRPAVTLLELDAIGSSSCMVTTHSLPEWEADLRYEINAIQALPHPVVYLEGGYSDGNSPQYTAKILNAVGIGKIRGFFTNDTHSNWTINEVRWATRVSKLTHGAHFIVNTSDNGRGPLLNRNRVKNGNENLCNPPGRGIGPMDTTNTGSPYADALLWTHPPGNSAGSCGGGPPSGTFWPARAVQMAEDANQRLGPAYPSRPY